MSAISPNRRLRLQRSLALLLMTLSLAPPPAAAAGTKHPSALEHAILCRFDALLKAENAQDLPATRALFRDSEDTLFVGKTPPGAADNWGGFWGEEATTQISALWHAGGFAIAERASPRVTRLGHGVAQLYAPVSIRVAYAGQSGKPRPFLLILNWVRERGNWKIASDIAIPAG